MLPEWRSLSADYRQNLGARPSFGLGYVVTAERREPRRYTSADRSLEWALLFNFLVHALALISMALLLLPCLPGGTNTDDAARVARIASHPWLFRLGWLPWQLCAVADLWLALAMLRVNWLSKLGSAWVVALTCIAVIPDQYAQAVWVTQGVTLAQTDAAQYLELEQQLFPLTAGWGALTYTLAALGWTYCFARAKTWSRILSVISGPLWLTMLVAVTAPLLPPGIRPSPTFVSVANGVGFLTLQVWLGLVAEAVLARARPTERYGRLAPWRHPGRGLLARGSDVLANSRFFGALLEPLPEAAMKSDITNVVYVNYLLRAADAERLVPPKLVLQRLGPDGEYALFTFLTYQHGHFGFKRMGPLRRLMPSPVQTNWRIHVRDPNSGHVGIYFLTNAINSLIPALAARLLTEGMPMHVLQRANVTRSDAGRVQISLDPGDGTAPDAELDLAPTSAVDWGGAWAACWPTFRAFLEYCVPQDRAMASQPLRNRVSRQEIDLGIPIEACEPLEGSVQSRAAARILGPSDAPPVCFRVATVDFNFAIEAYDHYPASGRGRNQ